MAGYKSKKITVKHLNFACTYFCEFAIYEIRAHLIFANMGRLSIQISEICHICELLVSQKSALHSI